MAARAALLLLLLCAVAVCAFAAPTIEEVVDEFLPTASPDVHQRVVTFLKRMEASQHSRQTEDLLCYDVDCGKNVTELITSKGYPCEDHYALTPDGYWLSLQRIPYGINGTTTVDGKNATRPVVFLQHGLLDASHTWVINMPYESLGFILADAGYDVWMGNNRGNTYSNTNEFYSYDDDDFWKFTWDEMASTDLPTHIDYVLSATGVEQLYYVGHSEGTTQGFAGFQDAELAAKVKLFVALAPVAYAGHITSDLLNTLAAFRVDEILVVLGFDKFLVQSAWLDDLLESTCDIDDGAACNDFMCSVMGCDPDNFNSTRWDVYTNLDPAGTSTRNINHWGQMVRKDNWCYYSYLTGHENKKHYGSRDPPCYDLSLMAAPVALFSGGKDDLGDPTDVATLASELQPNLIKYQMQIPYYSHMDFVWGMDAYTVLYPQILSLFESLND